MPMALIRAFGRFGIVWEEGCLPRVGISRERVVTVLEHRLRPDHLHPRNSHFNCRFTADNL